MTRGAVIAALLVALAAGCSSEKTCPCPPAKVLDQELMLLLSTARAYHHQADVLLQQGEVAQAVEVVRKILALGLDAKWPEAEEVRLDAVARLAKLLLGQGNDAEALKVVDQALKAGARESFYLGNLHSVRGEILEQQSKRLDQTGDKEEARRVARSAIAAFEESIAINKRLQQRLVQEGRR